MNIPGTPEVWFWVCVYLWNVGAYVTFRLFVVTSRRPPPVGGYAAVFVIWPVVPVLIILRSLFSRSK